MIFTRNNVKRFLILLLFVSVNFLDCYSSERRKNKKIELAKKKVIAAQQQNDTLMCVICRENDDLLTATKNVIRLNCHRSHQFHSNCLRDWAERSENCPYCHVKIPNQKLEITDNHGDEGSEENDCGKEVCAVLGGVLALTSLISWACWPNVHECLRCFP